MRPKIDRMQQAACGAAAGGVRTRPMQHWRRPAAESCLQTLYLRGEAGLVVPVAQRAQRAGQASAGEHARQETRSAGRRAAAAVRAATTEQGTSRRPPPLTACPARWAAAPGQRSSRNPASRSCGGAGGGTKGGAIRKSADLMRRHDARMQARHQRPCSQAAALGASQCNPPTSAPPTWGSWSAAGQRSR